MDVDLSVNKQSGLESVSIIQAYLDDARLGAVLRHLIFLLKQLLHQSGLDEPFTGGIGSYALAIMIIFYLKTSDVATDPENEDLMDFVHILFLGWLEYFGVEFDYSQYSIVISKDPGGQASLSPRSDNDFTLSIIDPQNPSKFNHMKFYVFKMEFGARQ
jgi:non-canonical poly(A) RNA polymerase PAPD5/7